jgi:hypothetical protein
MITLTKIRDLNVIPAVGAQIAHLSAASGLLRAGSFLYVVADDELHLGVFRTTNRGPGELVRLFDGLLPSVKADRKRQKPDLEALTLLPPSPAHPHGAMLALGSGSTDRRHRGAVLGLDAQGALSGAPKIVDLSPLFSRLSVFRELNIEGAVVSGEEMRLFQRGSKGDNPNAIVRFSLSDVLAVVGGDTGRMVESPAIQTLDLGGIDGIPYTFTDATSLANGDVVFTAVAEDTADSYNDGPCAGAVVGVLDSENRVKRLLRLNVPLKVEGIDARAEGSVINLLLVTDADDPSIPAGLFSALMER